MSKNKGFTLIELLITVGIVGILSTASLYTYVNFSIKTQASESNRLISNVIPQLAHLNQQKGTCTKEVGKPDTLKGKYGVLTISGTLTPSIGPTCPTGCTITYTFNSTGVSKKLAGKIVVADVLNNHKISKSTKTTVPNEYLSPNFTTINQNTGDNCSNLGDKTASTNTGSDLTLTENGLNSPDDNPDDNKGTGVGGIPTTPDIGTITPTTPTTPPTTPTTPPTTPTPSNEWDGYTCIGDKDNFVISNLWREKQFSKWEWNNAEYPSTSGNRVDGGAYFIKNGDIVAESVLTWNNYMSSIQAPSSNLYYGAELITGGMGQTDWGWNYLPPNKVPTFGPTMVTLASKYNLSTMVHWDGWYLYEICSLPVTEYKASCNQATKSEQTCTITKNGETKGQVVIKTKDSASDLTKYILSAKQQTSSYVGAWGIAFPSTITSPSMILASFVTSQQKCFSDAAQVLTNAKNPTSVKQFIQYAPRLNITCTFTP